MNAKKHGNGFFWWDNFAGHNYLTQSMKDDCQKINDDYSFFSFVGTHNGGYYSRDENLCWFHSAWRFIPENMLYETYKELLCDTDWVQGRWAYPYFFKPDLRKKVMELKSHDIIESPVLHSLLDDDGYLTVYYGHSEKTMRGAYSWTLDKSKAIENGYLFAKIVKNNPTFDCVTGKVKLSDVITFINGHSIHEITAMPRKVINQSKEICNIEDYRREPHGVVKF